MVPLDIIGLLNTQVTGLVGPQLANFLYNILIIAFTIGITTLSFRFYIVQKGDARWKGLPATDKYFVTLLVGIWCLLVGAFATSLAQGISSHIGLVNANKQGIFESLSVIIGSIYAFVTARLVDGKTKGHSFIQILCSFAHAGWYTLYTSAVLVALFAAGENNWFWMVMACIMFAIIWWFQSRKSRSRRKKRKSRKR